MIDFSFHLVAPEVDDSALFEDSLAVGLHSIEYAHNADVAEHKLNREINREKAEDKTLPTYYCPQGQNVGGTFFLATDISTRSLDPS